MSDQGVWFKLWGSAYDDPDLSIIPIADFGRWAKLGVYTKRHGVDGVLALTAPENGIRHPLESAFQVETFDAVIARIRVFPTCIIHHVSSATNPTVSFRIEWRNWRRYQGDFSTDRVHKHRAKKRANETPKKRREEMRKEERRSDEVLVDFSDYIGRFGSDGQATLRKVAEDLARTRKSGKVSPSILNALALKLSKYPEAFVLKSCQIYLDRGCANEGKAEAYLLGIVRGECKRAGDGVETPSAPEVRIPYGPDHPNWPTSWDCGKCGKIHDGTKAQYEQGDCLHA
jgi:hypothetical protein